MKKEYIFIICIVVILTIFMIVMKTNVNKTNNKNGVSQNTNTVVQKNQIEYDENTGYYYVRDIKTGEIRGASQDETELKIYVDNPDYDPDPSTTSPTDLNEYIETRELEVID